MSLTNVLDLEGNLTNSGSDLSGSLSIPSPGGTDTGGSSVFYDTKANWNRQSSLIAERGCIYIYKDAETKTVGGNTIYYCGMKVGDGSSRLIDLPYVLISSDRDKLLELIGIGYATETTGGYMSAADKAKLNSLNPNPSPGSNIEISYIQNTETLSITY